MNKFFIKKAFAMLLSLGLLANTFDIYGQDVDFGTILKQKPLALNGGVSLNSVFTYGLPNNNKPISYFFSGNLNFNFFNTINVPVSINLTDRKVALSQGYSFNQLSFNPTYKWATAHIGTNYMNFSPYTLSGHQFLGGGLELRPSNWDIQLMSGRLRKGQFVDTLTTGPTFKRMGYGLKVAYNPGNFIAGVTIFKSDDFANTIPIEKRISKKSGILSPENNMVIALNFGTTLFHALQFNAEYSNSVITKDKGTFYDKVRLRTLAGVFTQANATSQSFNAFKANVNYNIAASKTFVGLGFEKVDPDYKTHGGYYFVNDLINYTVNLTQPLFKNKLNFAANVGVQTDDIKKTKASNGRRFVGSINANGQVNEKLSMGINFSNFQSFMFVNDLYAKITRVPGLEIDSLDFSMISQNFSYNLNKSLKKTESQNSGLTLNVNYLISQNKREQTIDPLSKTNIFNSTIGYMHQYVKKNLSINIGTNFINNKFATSNMSGVGPSFSLQKGFLKNKLNTNLSLTWLKTKSEGNELPPTGNSATNIQLGANYSPIQKHSFNFNSSLVKSGAIKPYINGNLGYSYSF
jgi:hypothetical protein